MPLDDGNRQRSPLESDEPADELGLTSELPSSLRGRKREQEQEEEKEYPPSVKNRWERSLTVTFTSGEISHRLRELALEWDLYAPDGKSPATSTIVEYLLLPRLEAAEEGKIEPPSRGWRASRRS